MSALIVANFAAAVSMGFAAMVIVAAYVMLTPSDLPSGAAAMIGGAVFLGLFAAIAATIMAFIFFLAGLIAIGIPTWWVLHRTGLTSGIAFAAVGAIESVLGAALVKPLLMPLDPFVLVLVLALPGSVAGWVIWQLGYDQTPTPLPPPPPAPPS
jgi:hypothetical protein